MPRMKKHILVCGGIECAASASSGLVESFRTVLKARGLEEEVRVVTTGCFGLCASGPVVQLLPDNTLYVGVAPQDAEEIVSEHLQKGHRVERLLHLPGRSEPEGDDRYKKQLRIVLRNCGFINPENIGDYLVRDGYAALEKALLEMTPQEVIDEVKKSGLRGRGGGGFSTGRKWESVAVEKADQKYVICNADEGDPGAFMDRSVLEGDPHSIVEAMTICGYAIGASKGVVYIRAEYPLAIKRLQKAIHDARDLGLLGEDILGSGFSFDIDLAYGAGAFVCGEATALVHSLESERGEPRSKPPHLAESGYWGKPSNLNNVETFANIPAIIRKGAEWFSSIGTEKSKGTKVFALAGKINNVGLIEVPMGTTLREIIYDIGGGMQGGKKFKAVQTGGPSGGCLTESFLDTPIDYDNLIAVHSMMGSGGMIVLDEGDCMVDVAKFYLNFTVDESCGKCTPCRVGNQRLLEMMEKVTDGTADEAVLKRLRDLSVVIRDSSLCGLGQSAPNPILSTLDNFYDEYAAHVKDKRCPAGKCKALIRYVVDAAACKGCTLCAKICPVTAVSGKIKEPHVIDQERCTKCGACFNTCRFGAISRV